LPLGGKVVGVSQSFLYGKVTKHIDPWLFGSLE